ncbi:MAG: hypothetical protein JXM73_11190 [Anaerolineae bacterium]|nr:hypothetical protein [Anaerolineae bacterium]
MSHQRSLFTHLSEAVDHYRAERRAMVPEPSSPKHRARLRCFGRQMIPNVGTLLLVVVLLLTVPSLAAPRSAPEATSTSTISYQGRLADSSGNPLTGYYNLEFRVYDVPTGGTPLWEEFWTGGNSVAVSDGLFNVMLGSINTGLAAAIEGHDELYLGITVGTDSEMAPRVQLGSVPFAMYAAQANVPDGSITTDKIADGAVTQVKAPFAVAGPNPENQYRIEFHQGQASGGSITLTFDQAFTVPPDVFAIGFYNGPVSKGISIGNLTTTSVTFVNVDPPNITVRMMAIGY